MRFARTWLVVRASSALAIALGSLFATPPAVALDQPQTPQPVADYFATGLIPRLIDLYGSGDGTTKGTDFDATTKVGAISRVREWSPDFIAGQATADPTRLTNDWVASVSVHGATLGLATVWINPADDQPELASFDSAELAIEVSKAPPGSWLIHDTPRQAWFALTENGLVPLVSGTSGVLAPIATADYQRLIRSTPKAQPAAQSGVAMAALVLGVVTLGVALFVLLPLKRKGGSGPTDSPPDGLAESN